MKHIAIKCGIYDTEYTLATHKDGSVTLRAPYIKWEGNTGNLAFRRVKVPPGELAQVALDAFSAGTQYLPGYHDATLADLALGLLG